MQQINEPDRTPWTIKNPHIKNENYCWNMRLNKHTDTNTHTHLNGGYSIFEVNKEQKLTDVHFLRLHLCLCCMREHVSGCGFFIVYIHSQSYIYISLYSHIMQLRLKWKSKRPCTHVQSCVIHMISEQKKKYLKFHEFRLHKSAMDMHVDWTWSQFRFNFKYFISCHRFETHNDLQK